VKLEQTGARNDQLQETVSTLTRELADSRAQAKDARTQAESHRNALTQAKTERAQVRRWKGGGPGC
jgi:F0F1-type ATP synthase membrane subunit b/b'